MYAIEEIRYNDLNPHVAKGYRIVSPRTIRTTVSRGFNAHATV